MNKKKHADVLEKMKLEIAILMKMDHENIVKFIEVYEDQKEDGHIYLVQEYI